MERILNCAGKYVLKVLIVIGIAEKKHLRPIKIKGAKSGY